MPGGGGTLQTAGTEALREPIAPPSGQMQERAGPEQGRTDKDAEAARQRVQTRLVIYLSTYPGPTVWEVLSRLPRLDHERWTRKTFRGEISHSTFDGLHE